MQLQTNVLQATGRKRGRIGPSQRKGNLELLALAAPALIWIFIFCYIPMGGLVIAFKNFNYAQGIFGSAWSGFRNFEYLFRSSDFKRILFNTMFYNLIFILLGNTVPVVVALLLDAVNSRRWLKVFQTTYFLPYFISWAVVALIAKLLLDYDNGFFNQALSALGGEPVIWYQTPTPWRVLLPIFNLWKGFGYSTVVYYGTIMGMSQEIFEASAIDGCNKMQTTWYITLPQLKPTMIILMIMGVGNILRGDIGLFCQVTGDNGLLYPATDVIDTYLLRSLTVTGDIGISAAIGFFQSVVGFFLVIITNHVAGRFEDAYRLF